MSALNSSSTLDQVKAAYDTNAGYEVDASAVECQNFINACVMLLRRLPLEASKEGQSLRLSLDLIKAELAHARAWLYTSPAAAVGGGATFSDFRDFR